MSPNLIKELGVESFVVFAVILGGGYLIRKMLDIGEKHLSKYHDALMSTIASHQKEREKWSETYDKMNEKIDKSLQYLREEHIKQMQILEEIHEKVVSR